MLSHVDSTILFTENLPRMLEFYRDVLELPVLFQTGEYALLGLGSGSMIGLAASSQVHGQAREPQRMMINFFCQDVHTTAQELEQRGVRFVQAPYDQDSSTVATFVDPDGNMLQLITYAVG